MHVAVVVCGSRGDVQPMLALAVGLQAAGHDTVVCSSPDNGAWARSHGCAFEDMGEPLRDNPSLGADWVSRAFNRFIRRQLYLQVRDLPRLVEGCDLIVASGLVWGVPPVAERLGVPYRYVAFTPAGFLGTPAPGGRSCCRCSRWQSPSGSRACVHLATAFRRAGSGAVIGSCQSPSRTPRGRASPGGVSVRTLAHGPAATPHKMIDAHDRAIVSDTNSRRRPDLPG